MTAVVFSTSTDQPTIWLNDHGSRVAGELVNTAQLATLNAMLVYAALQTGRAEFAMARDLADHFGVASLRRLPAERFIEALTRLDLARGA